MFNNQDIKPFISIEEIFLNIDDEHIFSHYIGEDFYIDDVISSPLRDDNIPSFGVFESRKFGILLFKDMATGEKGDAVVFVKKLFGYDTIFEACSRIAIDFGIADDYKISDAVKSETLAQSTYKKQIRREKITLQVKMREWSQTDLSYWKQFNITPETLKLYNVFPISHYFMNGTPVKCITDTYCYYEHKDEITTYKIYQPFAKEKKDKWKSNVDGSVWQGWEQMPKTGKLVIITKSYKDIMSILDTTGIVSTAIQSETYTPKASVVEELKSRFEHVCILFDNDYDNPENPGRKAAIRLSEMFEIPYIEIPSEYQSKDFSDLLLNHGTEVAKNVLNTILNNKLKTK